MEFKRPTGSAGSIPRDWIDEKLPTCPFCGSNEPLWEVGLEWKPTMARHHFRCQKCEGILSIPMAAVASQNASVESSRIESIGTDGKALPAGVSSGMEYPLKTLLEWANQSNAEGALGESGAKGEEPSTPSEGRRTNACVETAILRGNCVCLKNDVSWDKAYCDFSYDHDLRIFKLTTKGDIWTSFEPSLVQRVVAQKTGAFLKKWEVNIQTKWPEGDEFTFIFQQPNKELAESTKAKIHGIVTTSRGFDEVIRLLKTRERVPSSEVAALLSKFNLDATDQSVQHVVESAITSGQVEGVFDGKEFIRSSASKGRQSGTTS
ncbi:MAG: hypothetical protein ABR867_04115 [Nitrososphaerales archaeon]